MLAAAVGDACAALGQARHCCSTLACMLLLLLPEVALLLLSSAATGAAPQRKAMLSPQLLHNPLLARSSSSFCLLQREGDLVAMRHSSLAVESQSWQASKRGRPFFSCRQRSPSVSILSSPLLSSPLHTPSTSFLPTLLSASASASRPRGGAEEAQGLCRHGGLHAHRAVQHCPLLLAGQSSEVEPEVLEQAMLQDVPAKGKGRGKGGGGAAGRSVM